MSRSILQHALSLGACLTAGLVVSAAPGADDGFATVRITDRQPQTVVRAQSPDDFADFDDDDFEDALEDQEQEFETVCPDCPRPKCETRSVSCSKHGGHYDSSCPQCRFFTGHDAGNWGLDAHGHAAWMGDCPRPRHGFAEKCSSLFDGCGARLNKMWKIQDGCYGTSPGIPPIGHYKIVYPVDPTYFDGRDGQVYAAQGYGGPVSVPLAPVVRHTYNYGWGVPSSRLTPISHPLPLGARP